MSILTKQKSDLIDKALLRFKSITPCSNKTNINDCFTIEKLPNGQNWLFLWYNDTILNSTHIEKLLLN